MSHFSVLVIGDNVEEQLAPYHEFECTGEDDQYVVDVDVTQDYLNKYKQYADPAKDTNIPKWINEWSGKEIVAYGQDIDKSGDHKYGYIQLKEDGSLDKVIRRTNPNKKWDWWKEGGRWSKWAIAKGGGRVISGPKSLFDFDAMKDKTGREAFDKYETVLCIVGDAEYKPFSHFRDECDMSIEAARITYWRQESVKRLQDSGDDRFRWDIDDDLFRMSRDEYVEKARKKSVMTYAIVKDGKWYARGDMGWFGVSHDEKDDWENTYHEILNSVTDDTLLTVVDCHI